MKAEIVSIGTELLLGSITDTNASYLAQKLAALGIDCFYVSQVGDNEARIVETLRRAWDRSDLTITTGGLGPTGDDLTRESIATMLGESPYIVPELEEKLRAFFTKRGLEMPNRNLKQASLIPSAATLSNPVGTAPGWIVRRETPEGLRMIVSMPGVPYEMKRMWEHEVEPLLRPLCPTLLVSRTLKVLGMGESAIDELAADLMLGSNPTLAPYAKADGVHLRITAKAGSETEAHNLIEPLEAELRARLGDAIYGIDDDTPASVVTRLLAEGGIRLALVEIGQGAIGAISARLAGCANLVGGIIGEDPGEVSRLLDAGHSEATLAQIGSYLLEKCGADLTLGVTSQEAPAARPNSVQADIEIMLIPSNSFANSGSISVKSSWTTSSGEVPRLAGLAALNLLRKWLLHHGKRAGLHYGA